MNRGKSIAAIRAERARVDPWKEVPFSDPSEREVFENGRRRCRGALDLWARLQVIDANERPDLLDLLADCYLQGVRDAAETLYRAGVELPGVD